MISTKNYLIKKIVAYTKKKKTKIWKKPYVHVYRGWEDILSFLISVKIWTLLILVLKKDDDGEDKILLNLIKIMWTKNIFKKKKVTNNSF